MCTMKGVSHNVMHLVCVGHVLANIARECNAAETRHEGTMSTCIHSSKGKMRLQIPCNSGIISYFPVGSRNVMMPLPYVFATEEQCPMRKADRLVLCAGTPFHDPEGQS